ncbi:hypothetical protein [Thalassospira sp. MCCC 1A01428]|uniref:hypothetical protein n=1 Tax=Thalassospira sp. MCCC 1A01428 TaxID=1470575 RepID=UPI00143D9552|nr:hypothetical protein [Thalassospira sp. MCCC 1A01428]
MAIQIKSPVSLAGDIRATGLSTIRQSQFNAAYPFAQFLFPLADIAGAMLEGVK